MFRILFQWRGIKIHAYPAMLYIGLVFGVFGGTYVSRSHGLDPGRVYVAMLVLIVPALVGARLLFVISNWNLFSRDRSRIWRKTEGGAALYGGLFLSIALSVPLLMAMHVPFVGFWDSAAITILIGMIPTKIGCLLNGCCAGRPTLGRFGMSAPNERGEWCRRIPAQLLEAGLAAVLLISSIRVYQRLPYDGVLFCTASIGYGSGRWWLESIRESIDKVGRFNLHRAISAGLVVFSAVSLILVWIYRT